MKIVIDIPKIMYGAIKEYGITFLSRDDKKTLRKSIADGTPLPKHHGRLIDADALLQKHRDFDAYPFPSTTIRNAPTIIEADKGSESE